MPPLFLGILQAILGSISFVAWKKALFERKNLSEILFGVFGPFVITILAIGAYVGGYLDIDSITPVQWCLLTVFGIGSVVGAFLSQYLNRVEKFSVLAPYQQISPAAVLIINFFVYRDASVLVVSIALAVIVFIALASFDRQTHHFSEHTPAILVRELLFTVMGYIVVYLLHTLSVLQFQAVVSIVMLTVFAALVVKKETPATLRALRFQTRLYWIVSFVSLALWLVMRIIERTMIHDLGVTLTTILGFFGFAFSLVSTWLILGEKPEKKSVLIAVVAMGAIAGALALS